jgi:hypothetical protein
VEGVVEGVTEEGSRRQVGQEEARTHVAEVGLRELRLEAERRRRQSR